MTNYGIVLIDDLRSFVKPQEDATVIRTSAEAVEWLATLTSDDSIDQLWLDHDLGKDEADAVTDIMPFVRQLEERAFFDSAPEINEIIVHTSNGVGAKNITDALGRFFRTLRLAQADLDTYLVQ